jgi:Zn-dependent protease
MLDTGDLGQRLRDGVVYLIALILSICVHEFGHAFVADRLGDPLPRAQGRVTLNPAAHVDPIGTLALPMMAFLFPSFGSMILGWGKPVRWTASARYITRRITMKTARLLVAAAGPLMNILFGLVLSGVFLGMLQFGSPSLEPFTYYVAFVIKLNIGLAFFNLIPCPPLDGGSVLYGILPRDLEFITESLEKYGFMILMALLWTGALGYIMIPAREVAQWWLGLLLRGVSG